jgi:hypothetical protein
MLESIQRVKGDNGASGTLGADIGVRKCSRDPRFREGEGTDDGVEGDEYP